MDFDTFLGEVQQRAKLASQGEALRITRATLTTLGERLGSGEATDLAAPLPMEIDRFLTEAQSEQRIDYDEFVDRVADRASTDQSDANFYAQVVLDVVADTVPESEFRDVRDQLPSEYDNLFKLLSSENY
ncbi:DUF2267 domain-containing protein [Halocatena salina]|uniref:DUF2267 domain-containing protein n=1 Tax=Halocatena salina TaxID=2934340 RepID=A0A8U0A0R9_9EURY|nr:DUF2267 domain-containing protein [Halocatena salina]UPM42741.1 DUF2267 domain-containing protein [Halocatena salina]